MYEEPPGEIDASQDASYDQLKQQVPGRNDLNSSQIVGSLKDLPYDQLKRQQSEQIRINQSSICPQTAAGLQGLPYDQLKQQQLQINRSHSNFLSQTVVGLQSPPYDQLKQKQLELITKNNSNHTSRVIASYTKVGQGYADHESSGSHVVEISQNSENQSNANEPFCEKIFSLGRHGKNKPELYSQVRNSLKAQTALGWQIKTVMSEGKSSASMV